MIKLIGNKEIEFRLNKETGEVFCTSLDVARVFEKRHDHILRDIEKLIADMRKIGQAQQLPKIEVYKQKLGYGAMRVNKLYTLTRDTFAQMSLKNLVREMQNPNQK